MITKPISTLKVQKLTQEQYDTAFQNGTLDNDSIYLTPTEIKDYALRSDLDTKADLVDGKVPLEQLPEATSEKLGVVKVGSNLSVADDGTLSANIPATWDWDLVTNKPSLYTQDEVNAKLDDKQQKNLVTSVSSTSTDTQYPSAKAVYDQLATKQDELTFDSSPTANSANPITSGGVKTALDGIIQIAEGKCATYVFDYYETLYKTLTGKDLDGNVIEDESEAADRIEFLTEVLNAGDIFLIRDLTVPDYWWEPQGPTLMLAEQTYGDIVIDGYGSARVLETTKCDLADYALKGDIPQALSQLTSDADHRLVTDAEKAEWSAKSDFSGDYNDLVHKPISLPANGGNADTIDNYHIRTALEGDTGLAGHITFIL